MKIKKEPKLVPSPEATIAGGGDQPWFRYRITYTNKDVKEKIYFNHEENAYVRDVFRKVEEKNLDTLGHFFNSFVLLIVLFYYTISIGYFTL